jgi:altronate dehydratase
LAVSTLNPYSGIASDLVSLKEASALLSETGPGREASPRTLKRWAVKHRVNVHRVGKEDYASWTDLLEVHAREIDRREAGA